MTPQELMAMAKQMAVDGNEVNDKLINNHITAGERIFVRQVSEELSRAAIELIKNPTS